MLAEYDEVKGVFGAATFTPPGFGPSLDQRLAEHPQGRIWQRKRMMSAWDVIRHEFESDHMRAFLLWQAFQTLVPVDMPGSGQLAASIVFGRQRRSWTLPRGGSGALTDALVRYIADRGGTVLCDHPVARLVVDGGRCTGVETEAGERFLAREAVVSTIHVKHLVEMAPEECWDEEVTVENDPKDKHQLAGVGLGAAVGAAVGKDVGHNKLTTAVAAFGGALAGKKIQEKIQENNADKRTETQTVHKCGPPGSRPQ